MPAALDAQHTYASMAHVVPGMRGLNWRHAVHAPLPRIQQTLARSLALQSHRRLLCTCDDGFR
eukprot:10375131-Prorocentrum_lima.AAC.1